MTYYKYERRQGLKPTDYGVVTKSVNTAFEKLQKEKSEERAQREKSIADLQAEAGTQITEAQTLARKARPQDKSFHSEVLSVANQSAQHMRALQNLLRAGKINPSDFAIGRQNLTDSVTQLKVLMQSYKDVVDDANKNLKEGELPNALNSYNVSRFQKIIDLEDNVLSLDPSDGVIKLQALDPTTGDPIRGNYQSTNEIIVSMMNKYDPYDLRAGVKKFASDVGAITIAEDGTTTVNALMEVDERAQRNVVEDFDNWIDALDAESKSSILTDNMGGDYEVMESDELDRLEQDYKLRGEPFDENKYIRLNHDPISKRLLPVFTPAQETTIKKNARLSLETMLPYSRKERDTTAEDLRIAEERRKERKTETAAQKQTASMVRPVMDLWEATTTTEVEAALKNLKSEDSNVDYVVEENADGSFKINKKTTTVVGGTSSTSTTEFVLPKDDIGTYYETVHTEFFGSEDEVRKERAKGRSYVTENPEEFGKFGEGSGASPAVTTKTVTAKTPYRNFKVSIPTPDGKKKVDYSAPKMIADGIKKKKLKQRLLEIVDADTKNELGLGDLKEATITDATSLPAANVLINKLKDPTTLGPIVTWFNNTIGTGPEGLKYITIDIDGVTDGPIHIAEHPKLEAESRKAVEALLDAMQKGVKFKPSELGYDQNLMDALYPNSAGGVGSKYNN